ncbi:MAG: response regulator [Clostridia bacterium]
MYRMLVVDDEALIRKGMRRALERLELFAVEEASSGREALKMLDAQPADAMLLDISMADMNGLDLMRALSTRADRPLTIIISGYEAFDYAKQALQYGAVDYILKPLDPGDVAILGTRLAMLLDERVAQAQYVEKMRKVVLENKDVIRQKLLYDILSSRPRASYLEDIRSVYGIDLTGKYFLAAVLHIRKAADEMDEVDFQVQLNVSQQVMARRLSAIRFINLFNMENARYVLLSSAQAPGGKAVLERVIGEIMQEINGTGVVECTAGVGGEVEGIERIQESYQSACDALDYRAIFGTGAVYDIDDYRKDDQVKALERMVRELESQLHLAQYEEAGAAIITLYDLLELSGSKLAPFQVRYYALKCQLALLGVALANGLSCAQGVPGGIGAQALPGGMGAIGAIGGMGLDAMRAQALALLDALKRELPSACTEKYRRIAELVRDFVKAHYADNLLSVNYISERLNYSANYAGNAFKKQYGMAVNDYINKVRIENAKRLMEETDLMIYEIAFRVGYNDQHYFSKIFKKYEAIPPTEYRQK